MSRLVGFLAIHFVSFLSEVLAMITFWQTGDKWFFSFLLMPFLFSGAVCTHLAWISEAPTLAPKLLPLRQHCFLLACLLAIPFGFAQLAVVVLAAEDFHVKRHGGRNAGGDAQQVQALPSTNRFHCKAINGLFEGVISAPVVLYAYWTIHFPQEDPITKNYFNGERMLLSVVGWTMLMSAGLGLLELDFCTSKKIARRMRKSSSYEFVHLLFRTSEVVMRVSVYIWFMVTLRESGAWWWFLPLGFDFLLTLLLVIIYGGAESTYVVRLLCSLPCVFANVFLFIDSPYKKRAARKLSRWLTYKNAITLLVLPILVYVRGYDAYWHEDLDDHIFLIPGVVFCVFVYWFLLWWVTKSRVHHDTMPCIYTTSAQGDPVELRKAIKEFKRGAAVGLNVNCADTDGNTPLILAAEGGHTEVVNELLKEGAEVDIRVSQNYRLVRCCLLISTRLRWTAVHIAAHRGHAEVLRVLLNAYLRRLEAAGVAAPAANDANHPFKDLQGDTPLHVAVRANKQEAVRAIARIMTDWKDVLNNRGQRPIDLAKPEVQQQVSDLLTGQTAATREGTQELLDRTDSQAWPQVELRIAATSSGDMNLQAPGLCSYIASSCGGALGRVFLANVPPPDRVNFGRDRTPSVTSQASSDNQRPLLSAGAQTEQPLPRVDSQVGGLASAVDINSMPAVDDWISNLQPITRDGDTIERWEDRISSGQFSWGPNASGRILAKMPLESILGEGAWGTVWRAKHQQSHMWFAVKNVKEYADRNVCVTPCQREYQVADKVRVRPHPFLVAYHYVHNFMAARMYMLVMEFCPGGDLQDAIVRARLLATAQRRTYTPPDKADVWVAQIFMGLEHLHRRMDVLLRDLKPANVVLDAQGTAKLTDFGFGRFGSSDAGAWSFKVPTGSPGYVAPEILLKKEHGPPCDLYSFGVLVWVLFSGGLGADRDAHAPTGMRNNSDFLACLQDGALLRNEVHRPIRGRRLAEAEKSFVLGLVLDRPEERMTHEQIRAHALLQRLPVPLPDYEAGLPKVTKWIRDVSADPGTPVPSGR